MSAKRWCAVPECTQRFDNMKKHLFRFSKDHDRWLQWIQACGRLDLQSKGPAYAYNNCYLCHLHFEERWYNVNKVRARLHPDAVPTRFFEPDFNIRNTVTTSQSEDNIYIAHTNNKKEEEEEIEMDNQQQQEINKNTDDTVVQINNNKSVQTIEQPIQEGNDNRKVSSNISNTSHISSDNSPRKKKLRAKILKLQAQNKTLRETIRRLRKQKEEKKKRKTTPIEKEGNEHTTLRELGHCDNSHVNLE
ncbi:P52K kinase [Camponotus japonicus]